MSEYIFFDRALSDRFVEFVAAQGIAAEIRPDKIAGFVIRLPDGLPDDLDDLIEERYDELMIEQQELVESTDENGSRPLMAVTITLPDGTERMVLLPAPYARRLLEHFTVDEVHEIVSDIARSIFDPVDGPLCRQAALRSA